MTKRLWMVLATGAVWSAGHSAVLFSNLVSDGNTGYDGSALIGYSNADDDWELVARPGSQAQVEHAVVRPASGWFGDGSVRRWIGAESLRGNPGLDVPGDYVYRLQISLPGSFDPTSEE
ncbi:MAG: hypothetical protein WHU10_06130, partial [Fimbriimonadales bacterium]